VGGSGKGHCRPKPATGPHASIIYVAVVRANIVFLGRAVEPAGATEASMHRAARLVCAASDRASQSSKHAYDGSERSLAAPDQ
jgi:hypothetical protein